MNEWIESHKTLVLSLIGLIIAGGLGAVVLRWHEPAPIVINPPAPTATASPIQVYVSGAVIKPDVYVLPPEAIVRDAINSAGGASSEADLNGINLAAGLRDGDRVHVPKIGEQIAAPTAGSSSGEASAPAISGPININMATAAELETLPEIGPALAQRIVDYRDAHGAFATIEAIQNVSGIGPATFEAIKDLITVE
jgi:competence protein ComEA